ncbi:MAG: hypothetical protein IPJ51_11040 [Saprospiraceae bacterium]|nr:hypothetical protein [Saprospiraceae bacterium]
MDFIKYTFALLVFAWATVTPYLDTAPLEFTPPVYETVDTTFIDMVGVIDSLETEVYMEFNEAKTKVIRNHKTIVKCAHKVDSLYEKIGK